MQIDDAGSQAQILLGRGWLIAPGSFAPRRIVERPVLDVALAREHGLDPAQMALAFVTQQPFVTSNIIGATTIEQLDSNIASFDLKLSDEVLAGIEAIHKDHPNPAP